MNPHRPAPAPRIVACAAVLLAFAGSAAFAQAGSRAGRDDLFRPFQPPRRGPAPPPVALEVDRRVPLPAPVVGGRIAVGRDGRLLLLLLDGWIAMNPWADVAPERLDDLPEGATLPDPTAWTEGGKRGRLRFRVDPDGVLRAERRCFLGGGDGFRGKWRLRLPGHPAGPPRAAGKSLYVGATDGRVYGLRARNGHRLWTRDLGSRVTRPLTLWAGDLPVRDRRREIVDAPFRLIVAVPDDGRTLHVLDPHDGSDVGTWHPAGDEDRLVTGAVALSDGRIAVVRQGYRAGDVELLLLRVTAKARESLPPEPDGGTPPPEDAPDPGTSGSRATPEGGTDGDPRFPG